MFLPTKVFMGLSVYNPALARVLADHPNCHSRSFQGFCRTQVARCSWVEEGAAVPPNRRAVGTALCGVEDLLRAAEVSYLSCHRQFTACATGRCPGPHRSSLPSSHLPPCHFSAIIFMWPFGFSLWVFLCGYTNGMSEFGFFLFTQFKTMAKRVRWVCLFVVSSPFYPF